MKDDLASSTFTHELRTPLNAIIGYTGTLLMGLPGPLNQDQESQLRIIQASARQLLALINGFKEGTPAMAVEVVAPEMDQAPANASRGTGARTRVLFIDDDPTSRKLMGYLLNAFGYDALMAEDGEQGLAMARREIPDLILTDIQMPGLGGFAVAAALKADPVLRDIPLVAVTALLSVDQEAKRAGDTFDYFLVKPIRADMLHLQLRSFLRIAPVHGHLAG